MKRNSSSTNFFIIVLIVVLWVSPILSGPPPDTLNLTILDKRILELEKAKDHTIKQLEVVNGHNKSIIEYLAAVVFILLTVQTAFAIYQIRREKKQDEIQAEREKKQNERQAEREEKQDTLQAEREKKQEKRQLDLDDSERDGAKRVANIMDVIDQTLRSRLTAEKEERKKRKDSERKQEDSDKNLQKILNQFEELERHYKGMEATRQKKRQNLDEKASKWASATGRHNFRGMAEDLNKFADKFDEFIEDSEDPEKEERAFTARVPYIRGIAAHYASQPEVAKKYLAETVAYQQPETGETEIAFKKRVANAYYYLGLTGSNFGSNEEAMDYFEKANALDPQRQDFLTKVVFAEACVSTGDLEKARRCITEVEEGLKEIEQREGILATFYLRLRSRAVLIRANMEILVSKGKWGEIVKSLLEPVHATDAKYYYATATLAQAYATSDEYGRACELFREAYETITASNDLNTVKEVRSRILLLMVSGMCSRHGLSDDTGLRTSNDYLDEADKLCGNLPMIDAQVCSVFSSLSKRNEENKTIFHHINLIRKGDMFLM